MQGQWRIQRDVLGNIGKNNTCVLYMHVYVVHSLKLNFMRYPPTHTVLRRGQFGSHEQLISSFVILGTGKRNLEVSFGEFTLIIRNYQLELQQTAR